MRDWIILVGIGWRWEESRDWIGELGIEMREVFMAIEGQKRVLESLLQEKWKLMNLIQK